jgi:hypothetical protein
MLPIGFVQRNTAIDNHFATAADGIAPDYAREVTIDQRR